MFLFRLLLFFFVTSLASAEHKTAPNQVYNKSSQLTVANINKAVEVLRDPTQMSGNFRQALKSYTPANTGDATNSEKVVPDIKLIGKVFVPKYPGAISRLIKNSSSVVLEINEDSVLLKEGSMTSIIIDEQLLTIQVDEITPQHVKLKLQPLNETLILH